MTSDLGYYLRNLIKVQKALREIDSSETAANHKGYWPEEKIEEVSVRFPNLGYSPDFLEQSRDMSLKESFHILGTLQQKLDNPPKFENSLPGDVAKASYSLALKRHFEEFIKGNRWIGPRYLASKVLKPDKATLDEDLGKWIHESGVQLYLYKYDVLKAEYIQAWDIKADLKILYRMRSLPRHHADKVADILGWRKARRALRFLEVDLLS